MANDRETATEVIERARYTHSIIVQGYMEAWGFLLAGFGILWIGIAVWWYAATH